MLDDIEKRLNSIMELKNQLKNEDLDNNEIFALLLQLKAEVGILAYRLGV